MKTTCPQCKEKYTPDLISSDSYGEKYILWMDGTGVEEVWPDAEPYQREQLISGMCSNKCWSDLFPPGEM